MIDEDKLNKTVIYINSLNSKFLNNTNFEFTYNIIEPIRNALYIKIMRSEVFLNPTNQINSNTIEDGDPIYISIKNHDRMCITIKDIDNVKCFEYILLNISEKFGINTTPNKVISFKTEYTSPGCHANDVNIITLNPVMPLLSKFEIILYDKNFNIIPKTDIAKFGMTLCIYHSRRKSTQY